ncbi:MULTISPECIES: carbohydrate kinase family protein [Prochlorococcus]|uniref:Sugar kinase, ribokinase family n=1 Tax=Prochlorococcus marinus (strain SARG / CCMP1375 / SS120) TaxID=167539 RepID=Q7VBD8_PROMA|nr:MULTISPECIES: PfkB family carbohydrate kinase [Prochlorococcus]AAQ00202.1 Sugar kinase, ribokinase family [Prochlorococcus marinus subsp. marinus str. CCMP1375]KGG14002.1 Ribokinase [Prochlorococcus marinus str. LG]KGG19134.1 Ribokinase [Prochlorococcus marinus str. SS2]KGG23325.1 Ribokinase [Prochlorococcus marinus str. SS35]KGG32440.1 Ribokinase [Prochlorococcus marinus str. SS51]
MSGNKELKLAVVGHIEWVSFLSVDKMPRQGLINRSNNFKEEPAGGGAVAAVQMSKLTDVPVHFFTSLGNDYIGEKSFERLSSFGITMHTAWRNKPTRRALSFIDNNGDRAITVIGERLQPQGMDDLPWSILKEFDGVFITAADSKAIQFCREAKILCATPRVKFKHLNDANIQLDALVGSNLDPDEKVHKNSLLIKPKVTVLTEGESGGIVNPGGRYKAVELRSKAIDSYGCGDSFAAGLTYGMAANMDIQKAINLGAKCGAACATQFGPYNSR